MIVSEDGTVTGSVDVSRLDEVEAKTDEARAQLDALKREHEAGRAQAEADSKRLAEAAVAGNPLVDEAPQDNRDAQGKSVPAPDPEQSKASASDKAAVDKAAAEQKSAGQSSSAGSSSSSRRG